jgi:hypothetical protein
MAGHSEGANELSREEKGEHHNELVGQIIWSSMA